MSPPSDAPPTRSADPTPAGGVRLLVVRGGDDGANTEDVLRAAGYPVTAAHPNPPAGRFPPGHAAAVVHVSAADPDPGDVCGRLKGNPATAPVPVLVIVPPDLPPATLAAVTDRADAVLPAGADPGVLVAAVRALVRSAETEAARRRAEAALRASEERFRLAATAVDGIIYDYDPTAGRVERTRGLFEVLGYHPIEAPPTMEWWLDRLHPDDATPYLDHLLRVAGSGTDRSVNEYRVRHRDGSYRHVADRAVLFRDAGGRVVRQVGCAIDVTRQKEAEAELQRRAEALQVADRRKDEFLAMLAHELRNPLAPIRNAVQVLNRVGPHDDASPRFRDMIDRQVGHLTRVVDDLLDVSRLARGMTALRTERVDLTELVRQTVGDFRGPLEAAGLALTLDLPADPTPIDGDRTRLGQIVGNLIHNAQKFTDKGGRVDVSLAREGREAVLTVVDTGVGIDADMAGRLFQTFSQADRSLARSRGGLGLGLALVKGLVGLHNGTVRGTSDGPGRGSRFTVRLPVAPGGVPADKPTAPAKSLGRLSVLVIEDNPDSAESLRMLLDMAGLRATVAFDGPSGLDAARRTRPDVVLCDIGLPGMDGYEVGRALRADPSLGRPLLVALTGYGREEDHVLSRRAGFDRHMTKPVAFAELQAVLAGVRPNAGE